MGTLHYGNTSEMIEMPDPLLAHVKVVIATKLRRSESFTLSWRHPAGTTKGRTTIWLQPAIPIRFVFESEEPETLNPAVLKEMANQANSTPGLIVDMTAKIPAPVVEPAPRPKATRSARVGLAA